MRFINQDWFDSVRKHGQKCRIGMSLEVVERLASSMPV